MKRYTLLVPTHSNAGNAFSYWVFQDLEDTFVKLFRGFTLTGLVHGCYVSDNGQVMFDSSRQYWIVTDNEQALLETVRDLCLTLDQECIYLELPGGEVKFVTRA